MLQRLPHEIVERVLGLICADQSIAVLQRVVTLSNLALTCRSLRVIGERFLYTTVHMGRSKKSQEHLQAMCRHCRRRKMIKNLLLSTDLRTGEDLDLATLLCLLPNTKEVAWLHTLQDGNVPTITRDCISVIDVPKGSTLDNLTFTVWAAGASPPDSNVVEDALRQLLEQYRGLSTLVIRVGHNAAGLGSRIERMKRSLDISNAVRRVNDDRLRLEVAQYMFGTNDYTYEQDMFSCLESSWLMAVQDLATLFTMLPTPYCVDYPNAMKDRQRRGSHSFFDESSDTEEAAIPLLSCQKSTQSVRSATVEEDLLKARQRAARLSRSRPVPADRTWSRISAAGSPRAATNECKETPSFPTSGKHAASFSTVSSASAHTLTSDNDSQHASVRPFNRPVLMSDSHVSTATSPATSFRMSSEGANGQTSSQKPAPYVFRKPTPIRGPLQQTFRVVFSEVGNVTRQQSSFRSSETPSNYRHTSSYRQAFVSKGRQPAAGSTQSRRGQTHGSSRWSRGKSRLYSAPYGKNGRGGRPLTERAGLKPTRVGLLRDESSQTKLKFSPSSQASPQHCFYGSKEAPASSICYPPALSEGSASPRVPSRSALYSPDRFVGRQSREDSNSGTRHATDPSGSNLRASQSNAEGSCMPSSSSLTTLVHEAATSEFRWKPPLSTAFSVRHEEYSAQSQSQRRSQQYKGLFNQDPDFALKNSKEKLAGYEWNTTNSVKQLSTASTRRTLPATPLQGVSSKRRRGVFDPNAMLSSSSSIHARSGSSRALLGSAHTPGGLGAASDDTMLDAGGRYDCDYDFGDVQDQDLIDLANALD